MIPATLILLIIMLSQTKKQFPGFKTLSFNVSWKHLPLLKHVKLNFGYDLCNLIAFSGYFLVRYKYIVRRQKNFYEYWILHGNHKHYTIKINRIFGRIQKIAYLVPKNYFCSNTMYNLYSQTIKMPILEPLCMKTCYLLH